MNKKRQAAKKLDPEELPPGRSLSQADALQKVQVDERWKKIEKNLKMFQKNEK